MVGVDLAGLAGRMVGGIRSDFSSFLSTVRGISPAPAGLYTYRNHLDGKRIIHLRIDDDGSGVLFADVTDVVHLNSTAAEMAKLALDGVHRSRAKTTVANRVPSVNRRTVVEELEQIYQMVDRLQEPGGSCPTCSVLGLKASPLFSIRARAPYKADLALTYGCNNQCAHCYNEAERFDMSSLPGEQWQEILDRLHAVGVPHVIFTGGEATLHPELLPLIQHADELGLIAGLNTNGRRLSHLPFARQLASAGLNHVQITLASNRSNIHDQIMGAKSFQQTVQGIINGIDTGMHVITNTTLMGSNMDHVKEIVEFLYGLGIRTFAMNGMIYSGGGFADPNAIPEEKLQPLLIRVRDLAADLGMRFLWYTPTEYCRMSPVELELGAKRCNAGEYSICIEPNGDVLPCQSYYVSAGNILHDAWEDIWRSDLFLSFRERETDPFLADLPKKCWHCPDLPLCGGGCRIEREARDGNRISNTSEIASCGSCSSAPRKNIQRKSNGFSPPTSITRADRRATGLQTGQIPLLSTRLNRYHLKE